MDQSQNPREINPENAPEGIRSAEISTKKGWVNTEEREVDERTI